MIKKVILVSVTASLILFNSLSVAVVFEFFWGVMGFWTGFALGSFTMSLILFVLYETIGMWNPFKLLRYKTEETISKRTKASVFMFEVVFLGITLLMLSLFSAMDAETPGTNSLLVLRGSVTTGMFMAIIMGIVTWGFLVPENKVNGR